MTEDMRQRADDSYFRVNRGSSGGWWWVNCDHEGDYDDRHIVGPYLTKTRALDEGWANGEI